MVGRERLTQMYNDWQNAQTRVEMMRNSLRGAENDLLSKEGRFKGAIELLGGATATWQYDPEKGILVKGEDGAPSELPANGPSGTTEIAPSVIPRPMRSLLEANPTLEIKEKDENGNMFVRTLPRNAAKRKRALRQLADAQR